MNLKCYFILNVINNIKIKQKTILFFVQRIIFSRIYLLCFCYVISLSSTLCSPWMLYIVIFYYHIKNLRLSFIFMERTWLIILKIVYTLEEGIEFFIISSQIQSTFKSLLPQFEGLHNNLNKVLNIFHFKLFFGLSLILLG